MDAALSSGSVDPSAAGGAGGRFGLLLFPGEEELDAVGPWEMATLWARQPSGPAQCLLIAQTEDPVTCAKGMVLQPHASFATAPPLDVLLVPGGLGTPTEVANPALIDFIRRQSAGCRAVLSVCTGAFLLHAAGLLSGQRATPTGPPSIACGPSATWRWWRSASPAPAPSGPRPASRRAWI